MTKNLEKLQSLRKNAPKPFGLYSATCIGLDGGLGNYLENFQDSNFTDFSAGLKVYRSSTYIPRQTRSKVIMTKGRVKLLEYAKEGDPILLIPSLVNKHYIFDLYEDNSLIKHLISKGKRPFVIDWGTPGDLSESLDLSSIIEDCVIGFSEYLNSILKSKINILGYCMGANFALIAASQRQELYKDLILVSPPYNFNEMPFTGMVKFYYPLYKEYLKTTNVKSDIIQSLFFMLDPKAVISRIKSFTNVKDNNQLKRMIALEDWLSDCIDVDSSAAQDILELWYLKNRLYKKDLNLSSLKLKTYIVTATKDSIVPNNASADLLNEIKDSIHIEVDSGHVGVMIGRKSKAIFYNIF